MDRIKWIDLARSLAIVFVIICHALEATYGLTLETMQPIGAIERVFVFSCIAIGRMGVPFFFFMTGYLLMGRDYDEEGCIWFWKHRWLPLLLCAEAWTLIYEAFLAWQGYSVSLKTVLCDMLFLHQVPMDHYWYIPVIIGIYLLLPVMAMGLNRLKPKTVLVPLCILIFFAYCVPAINVFLKAMGITALTTKLNFGFSGNWYGLYVIVGWAMGKGAFNRVRCSVLAGIGLASFALLVAQQMWAFSHNYQYVAWYNNVLTLVASVAFFMLLSHVKNPPAYSAVKSLAYYSFAVYLIHMMVVMLAKPYVLALPLPKAALFALLCILALSVSWVLAWAIGKIPIVGKRLLLLK